MMRIALFVVVGVLAASASATQVEWWNAAAPEFTLCTPNGNELFKVSGNNGHAVAGCAKTECAAFLKAFDNATSLLRIEEYEFFSVPQSAVPALAVKIDASFLPALQRAGGEEVMFLPMLARVAMPGSAMTFFSVVRAEFIVLTDDVFAFSCSGHPGVVSPIVV